MAAYWPKADGASARLDEQNAKVVLSSDSSFDVGVWENATLAAGDGVEQVRRLKASSGGSLVAFGGVDTVRSPFVAADLVDEYWLTVNPVVAGHGGSGFSDLAKPKALKLRSAKSYSTGAVTLIYTA